MVSDTTTPFLWINGISETNQTVDFELPGTIGVIANYENWSKNYTGRSGYFPITNDLAVVEKHPDTLVFFETNPHCEDLPKLANYPNVVIVLSGDVVNLTQEYRYFFLNLAKYKINNPVILSCSVHTEDAEIFQLWTSSEIGSILIDGFGDGVWLKGHYAAQLINSTSFGILQATRSRISKTEYISCPSCGRTLFDLQETTAKIRKRTSHLKGIKIGIMGCIVNGPGEMADADYGYVGTGPGKIHLYKEKTVVRKNVPEEEAVDALISLIKENGDWIEPKND